MSKVLIARRLSYSLKYKPPLSIRVIVHEVFALSTPCSLSIYKCGLKCPLTLLYGVIGVCALDFVSIERGSEARNVAELFCRCP